jgi:DNA-binding FrmR family transcriptional regulator
MEQNVKKSVALKLKKAQWQLAKVQEMLENDEYCINIIQQNMAVMGLLKSVQQEILQNHLHNCFNEWLCCPEKKEAMIEELVKVFRFYNK